jgi:hypothetical protein
LLSGASMPCRRALAVILDGAAVCAQQLDMCRRSGHVHLEGYGGSRAKGLWGGNAGQPRDWLDQA